MAALPSSIRGCDPGGRFLVAAEAFLSARAIYLARGAEGVRLLTEALLLHVAEDDGSGDEAFVEGCGAALGLVLAEALGGATASKGGRHLVHVGEHGAIDPFEIVRRALDDDEPREVLARGIELAQEEARGDGPNASAVRAFALALEESGARTKIRERFELELVLDDGTEVDLSRVRSAGGAGPAVARRLARMLSPRVSGCEGVHELKERLLPRVVGDGFLDRLGESATALALVNVAGGLHLGLIAHYGDRARFVRRAEIESAGESIEEMAELALLRLARTSPRLSLRGGVAELASRDGLDASRIVLPSVHRALAEALGARPFVAAPHRDLLLASTDRARLEALAADAYARAPHGVSPRAYGIGEGGRVVDLG